MKYLKFKLILIIIYFFINSKNLAYSYFLNNSLSNIVDETSPSVVSIYTINRKKIYIDIPKEFKFFFGENIFNKRNYNKKYFEGLGSGVIIDSKNKYIITNNHVVNNASKIKIKFYDGKEFDANIIGNDYIYDIALLKVNIKNSNYLLKEIKFCNSDLIKVGDLAIAIGNPFGLGQTVTSGIVSALGRKGLNIINGLENFIQTDASINKGNSGGALLNVKGELIGINTAILTPNGCNIGIGFAIPSNTIKKLSTQLIKYGNIKRGYIGIKCIELNNKTSNILKTNIINGIFVNEVIKNSPAEKYGIRSGDVIVTINNKKINNLFELKSLINLTFINEILKFKILRNNKFKIIHLKLCKNKNKHKKTIYPMFNEIFLKKILKNKNKLIKIIDIKNNSKLYKIGIRKNDFIIKINNFVINNIRQLKKIVNDKIVINYIYILRNGNKILFFIKNN
ncbi:protease degQ [endosymbiont of Euscepes postfasciatus]|uniref:trypsin-like peptidase domain-containing protein n=1 Tax=endosymbiont of Euscepes postfasciatus TaxID=650377 RepID=UPI000DC70CEB|nr:trypsin-like peptidase domain-containing protein [endosymbiont of Euscepes postfasciatus]BBA84608.1 protease degQ [endosymbiont of Euscepes postfasciatus]